MFGFFKRLWYRLIYRNLTEPAFLEDDPIISSIVYVDEQTGVQVRVNLICSCDNQASIIAMDDNYDPPIPHFECEHCDRVCNVKNCAACKIYSTMADARDIAEN